MKIGLRKGKENNKELENELSAGERTISFRRILYLIFITIVFYAAVSVFSYRYGVLIDTVFLLLIITTIFLLIFFLELRHFRLSDKLAYTGTSYRNIFLVIAISLVIMILGSFVPDSFFPIVIIMLFLSSVMDVRLSLPLCLYIAIVFTSISGSGIYILLNMLVLIAVTSLVADYLREEGFSIPMLLILFLVQILIPIVFSYFSYLTVERKALFYGAILGALDVFFAAILFPLFKKIDMHEKTIAYDMILDDDYSLVSDIRHFSIAEYEHARRVEKACLSCARLINANEKTAACGGFYYRLGVMYGEPIVSNGVKSAVNHCFPNDVVDILSEYDAKEALPHTVESAIVHIVSQVVTRLELLDHDTFSGGWNQNIVIIQVLNDLSSKGIYDDSGLGINQFLKIRDYLAKEDLLTLN